MDEESEDSGSESESEDELRGNHLSLIRLSVAH